MSRANDAFVEQSVLRWEQARAWLRSPAESGACRVKLCGMFRDADMAAVLQAAPDMCGFIVNFPKSHRSVGEAELAWLAGRLVNAELQRAAAAPIWRVGVFVDAPAADVVRIARDAALNLVQLHGHEDAAYVAALRAEAPQLGVIQAFRVRTAADVAAARESVADMVLLDSGQGTGERFDWSLLYNVGRPFILAGGLSPENVADAVREVRPWGVDMSSGIETDKLKDPAKMKAAVAAVAAVATVAQTNAASTSSAAAP